MPTGDGQSAAWLAYWMQDAEKGSKTNQPSKPAVSSHRCQVSNAALKAALSEGQRGSRDEPRLIHSR